MSSVPFIERRRYPRLAVDVPVDLRVRFRSRVRLLDLSETGALLAATDRLPPGTRGRLRVALGAALVEAPIEVEREGRAPDGRGRLAGVSLGGMQAGHRAALDDFLARAGD
jgi:c-di-GMP-binding flagellar brake protein YcgR